MILTGIKYVKQILVYMLQLNPIAFLDGSLLEINGTLAQTGLAHSQPMVHLCTRWKDQKNGGFLMFSGVIDNFRFLLE